MRFKIAMTVLSTVLATEAHSAVTSDFKEFGHWVGYKTTDDFDPNNSTCAVQNGNWYPQTSHSPEIFYESGLRLYIDRKVLTDSGEVINGFVALFTEWDNANQIYVFSGDLFEGGIDSKLNSNKVVAKVDGKIVDFLSKTLPEELKGKVELTYRYQASLLDNAPNKTNTISLIGFTQAWNHATELCNG